MMEAIRRVVGKHSDIFMVALVLGVLIVLFAPIPSGLLDFLIRFVGKVDAFVVGNGDQFGSILGGISHELEIGIGPTVEVLRLATETCAEAAERVEVLWMRDGKRAKENGIDQAKCGGTCADRQPKRKHRRDGRDFIFGELPPAVDCITTQGIEPRNKADVAHRFFRLFHAAELEQRHAAPLLGGHTGAKILRNV